LRKKIEDIQYDVQKLSKEFYIACDKEKRELEKHPEPSPDVSFLDNPEHSWN
jgi:hypothetical protein